MVAEVALTFVQMVTGGLDGPSAALQDAIGPESLVDLPAHERAAREKGETFQKKNQRLFVEEELRRQQSRDMVEPEREDADQREISFVAMLAKEGRENAKLDQPRTHLTRVQSGARAGQMMSHAL